MKQRKGFSFTGRVIEDIIILTVIVLAVTDFLDILPADIDYLKEIIGWSLMAYLLYSVSITRVFFGCDPEKRIGRWLKDKHIDIFLILTYFLFIVTKLVRHASTAIDEAVYIRPFYSLIVDNAQFLVRYSFIAGVVLLLAICLYAVFRVPVKKPSLLYALGLSGSVERNWLKIIIRFMMVFVVFTGFFVLVFNLLMEWLTITVDTTLLMVVLIFYLFVFLRHKEKFGPENALYKIGNGTEEFYRNFINLFRSKNTVFLAISGILVLHLLSDVAIFIVPYILGLHDVYYFQYLTTGHSTLFELFSLDSSVVTGFAAKGAIAAVYLLNLAAMLFLLIMPSFLWYKVYKGKGFGFPKVLLGLFFASVVCFGYTPVFTISPIAHESMIGANISTGSLFENNVAMQTVYISVIGSAIAFLTVLLAGSLRSFAKHAFVGLCLLLVDMFFGWYIYIYLFTVIQYYVRNISDMLFQSEYLIASYLFVLVVIQALFYLGGFIIFLAETKKEYRLIK